MQAYINPTLCKTTSRKLRRVWGCFAVLLRLTGKCIFCKDPFLCAEINTILEKTMVMLICESTSHVSAGLEIPPALTRCFNSVPALPQHSWNRCNVCNCAIKWTQTRTVCGASAKFYLHAHCFLYKLDYNSKWNTLEKKNPTNVKSTRSRLIKGWTRGLLEGTLAWASKTRIEKVWRGDCETVTSRRWWRDVSLLFLLLST